MSFYSLIDKKELGFIIKQAKKTRMQEVIARFENYNPANYDTLKEALPEFTPDILVRKRANKLLRKKREVELKKLFNF